MELENIIFIFAGIPCIGVLKHKERFYAFSSTEAALTFASSPEDFVAEVAEECKRFPELFELLKLNNQLPCPSPCSEVCDFFWVMFRIAAGY